MAVVIILSDLFIFNPSRAVCYAVGQPDLFAMASSLSHEVIVHRHDDDNNNEKDDDGELDVCGKIHRCDDDSSGAKFLYY